MHSRVNINIVKLKILEVGYFFYFCNFINKKITNEGFKEKLKNIGNSILIAYFIFKIWNFKCTYRYVWW